MQGLQDATIRPAPALAPRLTILSLALLARLLSAQTQARGNLYNYPDDRAFC